MPNAPNWPWRELVFFPVPLPQKSGVGLTAPKPDGSPSCRNPAANENRCPSPSGCASLWPKNKPVKQRERRDDGSEQGFQYDVFLSHSAKDKAVVRSLAERLRQDGLEMWFDEWVLKPGDSIPAKIEDGLEHSRMLPLAHRMGEGARRAGEGWPAHALGPDWAQLEAGTFRFRDPLNQERRLG